jgi:hypothetical protein
MVRRMLTMRMVIMLTLGVTLFSISPSQAWVTRYYKDAWLDMCPKSLTQEQCNATWDNLIARNDAIGMICSLGPKGDTLDCDKEK